MSNRWRSKGGFTGTVNSIEFEIKTWKSTKKGAKNPTYNTVSAKLMVTKDGADNPIEQYLQAGFAYEGQKAKGAVLTEQIDGDSDFAKFVDSIEAAGGDDIMTALADAEFLDFSAIEGNRFEFKFAQNVERQMASGRKKLGIAKPDGFVGKDGTVYTEAEVMEAGKRIDRKDKKKSYNQNYLTVVRVLAAAEETDGGDDDDDDDDAPEPPKAKKATNGSGKKVAAAEPDDEDDEDEDEDTDDGVDDKSAAKFLKTLLKEEDGEISRKDITLLVARRLKDRAQRDAMVKKLYSTAFLKSEAGWEFNESSKAQTITLG
jgi:hypothetical protein